MDCIVLTLTVVNATEKGFDVGDPVCPLHRISFLPQYSLLGFQMRLVFLSSLLKGKRRGGKLDAVHDSLPPLLHDFNLRQNK